MIEIDVPYQSMIIDNRKSSDMRKKTITNYRKKEVIEVFEYSMANSKLEDASKWLVELLCSGYIQEIWNIIIIVYGKYVNINNFILLEHIYQKYKYFNKYISKIDKKYLIHIRNTQEIRNLFISIVGKITLSIKNDIFDKRTVVKVTEFDFSKEGLLKNIKNTSLDYIIDIVDENDCKELKLAVNEIAFHLKKTKSLNNCMFWYNWICRLETIKRKDDIQLTNNKRDIKGIDEKYKDDWIWLVWKTIFKNIIQHRNPELNKIIKYLYEIYKIDYKSSVKQKRKYILFMAFYSIVISLDFKKENIIKPYLEIQAAANINIIYRFIDFHLMNHYNNKVEFDKVDYKKSLYKKYQEEVEKKIKRDERKQIKEKQKEENTTEEDVNSKMAYLDDLLFFKRNKTNNVLNYFNSEEKNIKKIIYL